MDSVGCDTVRKRGEWGKERETFLLIATPAPDKLPITFNFQREAKFGSLARPAGVSGEYTKQPCSFIFSASVQLLMSFRWSIIECTGEENCIITRPSLELLFSQQRREWLGWEGKGRH